MNPSPTRNFHGDGARSPRSDSGAGAPRLHQRSTPTWVLALVVAAITSVQAADKRRDAAPAVTPAPSAISSAKSFDAFQVIAERNIFNPNRTGRTKAAQEEKAPRVDEISLVGTMQYDKGLVAFFDSPDSAYRKALREGESVGDFKLQRITADGVELMREEKTITLKITQQLRRAEGGDWVVTATPVRADGGTSVSGSPQSRPNEPAPVEIPADASEVLKRLLKKRDKQLK